MSCSSTGWRFPASHFWCVGRDIGWKDCNAISTRPMLYSRCWVLVGVCAEKRIPLCRLCYHLGHPHWIHRDHSLSLRAPEAGDCGAEEEIAVRRRVETTDLRPFSFFTTNWLAFGFSLCGRCCLDGLTAYLLNVKVFVWFNPSILVTGTLPLAKGVAPSGIVCHSWSHPTNWEIGGAS